MKIDEVLLYEMIFKRKSFHLFRGIGDGRISRAEAEAILEAYHALTPLCPDIRTAARIVPAEKTTCRRGQEFCILLYSEKKENYLQNIGYLGEQLDLYLVSRNIGTLWFGIGKPEEPLFDGLEFVIMMAIAKVDDAAKFRKNMYRSKRKPLEEIWSGEPAAGVAEIVRFAPSACNTQPWFVERSAETLRVFRTPGKRGIMPAAQVSYYNRIDIGIFLCFLERCLIHSGIPFDRELCPDRGGGDGRTLAAVYTIRPQI